MRINFLASIAAAFLISTLAAVNTVDAALPTFHADALMVVLKSEESRIRELDPSDSTKDTKERSWSVVRSVAPGVKDTEHLFTVTLKLGGVVIAAWAVDTKKGAAVFIP